MTAVRELAARPSVVTRAPSRVPHPASLVLRRPSPHRPSGLCPRAAGQRGRACGSRHRVKTQRRGRATHSTVPRRAPSRRRWAGAAGRARGRISPCERSDPRRPWGHPSAAPSTASCWKDSRWRLGRGPWQPGEGAAGATGAAASAGIRRVDTPHVSTPRMSPSLKRGLYCILL